MILSCWVTMHRQFNAHWTAWRLRFIGTTYALHIQNASYVFKTIPALTLYGDWYLGDLITSGGGVGGGGHMTNHESQSRFC